MAGCLRPGGACVAYERDVKDPSSGIEKGDGGMRSSREGKVKYTHATARPKSRCRASANRS